MPEADLDLITRAAEDAGQIALAHWRGDYRHWEKDAGAGPVTEADLAVNAALEQALRAARPDYGWLSEESPEDPRRADAARVFVVDPIDGTRAFMAGEDGFAVAVAVVEDGQPIAGVVHQPARGVTYAAAANGPATRNGQPIRPRAVRLEGAEVLTTKAALDPMFWRGGRVPPFRRSFRPSLAWRLCLVAEGRFDATLSMRPVWEWDIAAASLIAGRAGCGVTDRRGRPLRFNRVPPLGDGLIVAPPALHGELVAALDVEPPQHAGAGTGKAAG
ncbi:3'(2'),5'-bisphosphate nucleotidase CysQ [Paracoccus sp. (in: a-proteobacteria)]|uniref:3'(2'),5'-bisphosphate nucleotidase CysQ n=1 Tax=Paracoccus sp. TaxID=267 RepID=UPI0026DFC4A8|nr:3'(2'),5'-bisphosphate nucleotidase CysQ [Paracoccus sp. (in: a-proteobacteria)]MDO5369832.1 3'(2'),5'-bisphosphate nucleotidase CysQ [Paracoccus sp. (in: a-proteobacteria)]